MFLQLLRSVIPPAAFVHWCFAFSIQIWLYGDTFSLGVRDVLSGCVRAVAPLCANS